MRNWGDLPKRALTALILGPIALACVWLGAEWWTLLMALCVAGLAWEWVRLCGGSTRRIPGAMVPAFVLMAGAAAVSGNFRVAVGILLLGGVAVHVLATLWRGPTAPYWFSAGLLYIGAAGISLIELRHSDLVGRDNVLFLLAVVWASDISAYAAGRYFGGPKLAPAISPNKTWTGAVGGLCGAAAVGAGAALAVGDAAALIHAMFIAAALGIATQAGDMLESGIKRRFGVKDSSGLLPGHGGLLDRLDGVMAAAPLAALLSVFSAPGLQLWR